MARKDHHCPVCETLIEPGQPVSFQHGELMHLTCYEALALAKKPLAKSPPPREAPPREAPPEERSAGA